MLLMGDENGRSQGGNNNAYGQDNEIDLVRPGRACRSAISPSSASAAACRASAPAIRCSASRAIFMASDRRQRHPPVIWFRPDAARWPRGRGTTGSDASLGLRLAGRDGSSALILLTRPLRGSPLPAAGHRPRQWRRLARSRRHRQRRDRAATPAACRGERDQARSSHPHGICGGGRNERASAHHLGNRDGRRACRAFPPVGTGSG